jgi:hypothetical protein
MIRGMKRPRISFRAVLGLALLAVPLLAVAYSVRKWNDYKFLAATKRYDCQDFDLTLLHRIRPNCEGQHSHLGGGLVPFRTNSLGLFEREPVSKRKGIRRVLLLGDSQLISYAPGFSLSEELGRRLGGLPVEIVNGANPGYSLVQLRMRARELVRIYEPDIVLFYYDYFSMGLNTTYLHLVGAKLDSGGLVESIGPLSFYWPIPEFLAERFSRSPELRYLATWLRSWQERGLLLFGASHAPWFSAARRGGAGIAEVQELYLRAIARESEGAGARFYLLRGSGCEGPLQRKGMKFFKSESEAIRTPFLTSRYLAACEEVRTRLPSISRLIDDPLVAADDSYFLPHDVHYSEKGMRELAAQLERGVRLALVEEREKK